MEIIIDAGHYRAENAENNFGFVMKFCKGWLELFQEDQIFLLGNFPEDGKISNDRISVLDPGINYGNLISEKYFYDFRLPVLTKKFSKAVFLSFSGRGSLKLQIPQIFFSGFHSIEFASADSKKHLRFRQRSRYKKLAARPVCFVFGSGFLLKKTEKIVPELAGKTRLIVPPVPDDLCEFSEAQKESIRTEMAEGKEYFLWELGETNTELMTSVLKGFSAFKKRQQTNMQIILTGMDSLRPDLEELLAGYKYRSDLHFTGKLSEQKLNLVRASAYAVLYPAVYADTERRMFLAMYSRVPLLCADIPLLKDLAGSIALYFDSGNPEDINRQMSFIFKNETERSELIASGFQLAIKKTLSSVIQTTREILLKLQRGAGIP